MGPVCSLIARDVLNVTAGFLKTFSQVVSEIGLHLLSGLPEVLCGKGAITHPLQRSRNISVFRKLLQLFR